MSQVMKLLCKSAIIAVKIKSPISKSWAILQEPSNNTSFMKQTQGVRLKTDATK
jgi:hypothetical protein